jgi:anti-sigma factor RsiW
MTDRQLPISDLPPSHPSDELLVGYLSGTLDDRERIEVEAHLRSCDDCMRTLPMMQHHLSIINELAVPIPETVRQQAVPAPESAPAPRPLTCEPRSPVRSVRPWFASLIEWVSAALRPMVLVPVAIAALALFVVVNREAWFSPAPGELTRSTQLHQRLRVTAPEAMLRAQPSQKEQAIAVLKRGTDVEIVGSRGEWLQVHVEGKEGWVERRAFD